MSKTFLFVVLLLAFLAVVYCEEKQIKTETAPEIKEAQADAVPEGEVTEDEEDEAPDVKESKLKDLFIRGVKISEEEAKTIATEIETNQQLDRFVLTKNDDLTPAVLKTIVSAFAKNSKLRVIGFTKNKIGDEGAAVIAEGIKDHSGLAKFYLYHTEVSAKGIASIVPALATVKSLVKSVVIENKIGDEGAQTFAEFLKGSKLTDFVLRDCEIKASGFKALGAAVKDAKSLLRVDFSENPMDADSVAGIASGLDGNDHLTHIELAFNNIDAAGAKTIAASLLNNKVLKRVDLSENKIGNDGAKEFASFIEKDSLLEKLDISNNKVTTDGAKGVIEAVLKNKNLKRLFFYRNEVDDSLKDLFAKAGDRIKSEYTDELKFKDEDPEDDAETADDKDEVEDDKDEEPKTDAKTPTETPKKDEL